MQCAFPYPILYTSFSGNPETCKSFVESDMEGKCVRGKPKPILIIGERVIPVM